MSTSLEDPFGRLCLADEVAFVVCGEICELVPRATAEHIHLTDTATWPCDLDDRYTMLAGKGVAA